MKPRATLNRILDRISEFETDGGIAGAFRRGVERVKAEQRRMRQVSEEGPLSYYTKIRQAYARLELPYGADQDEVRRAYRQLMRRYHPDRHASDPDRERVATEISQKLTVSYNLLVDHLKR